jgi:hypothetical protein
VQRHIKNCAASQKMESVSPSFLSSSDVVGYKRRRAELAKKYWADLPFCLLLWSFLEKSFLSHPTSSEEAFLLGYKNTTKTKQTPNSKIHKTLMQSQRLHIIQMSLCFLVSTEFIQAFCIPSIIFKKITTRGVSHCELAIYISTEFIQFFFKRKTTQN